MRIIYIRSGLVITMLLFTGCSQKAWEEIVLYTKVIPYVDRTELEVNDWFSENNYVVIDDTNHRIPHVINGTPSILLLKTPHGIDQMAVNSGSEHRDEVLVDSGSANLICITQYNQLPNTTQPAKYAAVVNIAVERNTDLFRVSKVWPVSCNMWETNPERLYMAPNIAFGRSEDEIKKAFRDAINDWLQNDIIATLKSTSNMEGFGGSINSVPRNPAKKRGIKYQVTEDNKAPVTRSISFFAE